MERKYLNRAIHLALLFILQTGFTVYGLVLLISIEAKSYVYAIWIPYQVIGWAFFFWQFVTLASSNREIRDIYDEMKADVMKDIEGRLAEHREFVAAVKDNLRNPQTDQTIEDGFGSAWSIVCPKCDQPNMQVVRPGKVQCSNCG